MSSNYASASKKLVLGWGGGQGAGGVGEEGSYYFRVVHKFVPLSCQQDISITI